MNGRERVLSMLDGGDPDHLPFMPITMQFAADIAGSAYREYATDYRVLVPAQIQTAESFGFDYVNTMSDPACEAGDCGAPLVIAPNSPPATDPMRPLIADKAKLSVLRAPRPEDGPRMCNRLRALELHRARVGGELLIEGWVEGPLAEGAGLRGLHNLMTDMIDDEPFVRDLLEWTLAMELEFARAQVSAGAELIGIGDAAASLVGPRLYREFVWPYEKRMVDGIRALGARTRMHICGNTRPILAELGRLGCDIVDLDFMAPMAAGRAAMGPEQVLLGNMDPVRVLRDQDADAVTAATAQCHADAGPRFIVGAGCEVPRDTAHANLRAMQAYAEDHKP